MSQVTAQQVAEFLQQNPNFLAQHPALLAELELQQKNQAATSLVHIQQRQLREHNTLLKDKITQLTQQAAQNELIYHLFSQCHRQLWAHHDFATLAAELRAIITSSPAINECHLLPYSEQFEPLVTHRLTHNPCYLGRLNQQEQALLFQPEIRSCALFLIGDLANPVAILAFGSPHESHFEPAQDTLFAMDFVYSLQLRLQALA